jgi:hypothetical protein
MSPLLLLYDQCGSNNDVVLIGATHGDNLGAKIFSGGTMYEGVDVTDAVDPLQYVSSVAPMDLYAFGFYGMDEMDGRITTFVDDSSMRQGVVRAGIVQCSGSLVLHTPSGMSYTLQPGHATQPHVVFPGDAAHPADGLAVLKGYTVLLGDPAPVSESAQAEPVPAALEEPPVWWPAAIALILGLAALAAVAYGRRRRRSRHSG